MLKFRDSRNRSCCTTTSCQSLTLFDLRTISIFQTLPEEFCCQNIGYKLYPFRFRAWGARDGAVVRALASHQCGPGLNPGVDVTCGLSLLLVLSFAPRGFSPHTPVFPSKKNHISKFRFDQGQVDEEPFCGCVTSKLIILLLLLLFIHLIRIRRFNFNQNEL